MNLTDRHGVTPIQAYISTYLKVEANYLSRRKMVPYIEEMFGHWVLLSRAEVSAVQHQYHTDNWQILYFFNKKLF